MFNNKKFSVAVSGSGQTLGMLISEGQKRFPRATWFDRSSRANHARAREVQLGRAGHIGGTGQAWRGAAQDLQQPQNVDVTVAFSRVAGRDRVEVRGRRRDKSFDITAAGPMKMLERDLDRILDAVKSLA